MPRMGTAAAGGPMVARITTVAFQGIDVAEALSYRALPAEMAMAA